MRVVAGETVGAHIVDAGHTGTRELPRVAKGASGVAAGALRAVGARGACARAIQLRVLTVRAVGGRARALGCSVLPRHDIHALAGPDGDCTAAHIDSASVPPVAAACCDVAELASWAVGACLRPCSRDLATVARGARSGRRGAVSSGWAHGADTCTIMAPFAGLAVGAGRRAHLAVCTTRTG